MAWPAHSASTTTAASSASSNSPARLLGQVQVAVDGVADPHGNAEERRHGRMPGREAVRMRVCADVGQPKRLGVLDEHTEDAVPLGEVTDPGAGGSVDPEGEEPLEPIATVVEDAQRGVPGAGELAGSLEHRLEHGLEVEVRHKRATDLEQTTKPYLIEPLAEVRSGKVAHGRVMVPVPRASGPLRARPSLAAVEHALVDGVADELGPRGEAEASA